MGYAARQNPRSPDGGKPPAYRSFHRCLRAVRVFGNDRAGFDHWLDTTSAGPHHRAVMEGLWATLHPEPRVGRP